MTPSLTRWITLLLATTSAMAVATVYFAQPLLESMAAELGVAQQQIGWVVGATQGLRPGAATDCAARGLGRP